MKNDGLSETKVVEIAANKTLHELSNGLAYYNYKGTHFRVFNNFEDGLKFLETFNHKLVIANFDTSDELDNYLEDVDNV